ncbi:MAG: transcription termination factor NusA [Candidatus Kaiserbacteria bacterium]|nr:transcription termination factor NusA [Candidatus Kaiserbacteria bacterium]
MFDVKEIKKTIQQIAESRQLPEASLWEAIESAFAAAYKREYGKSDHVVRARINPETGETSFFQVKQVLAPEEVLPEEEMAKEEDEERVRFNPERHIMIDDAQLVRQGVQSGEELLFPLESKTDFGRIAAQSARQAVTQKIHELEQSAVAQEFQEKVGLLVHGRVQRIERGNVYVDLGRTVAMLPYAEQIRGERFKQGSNLRAYILSVDMTARRSGGFVTLSRANKNFVIRLFEAEVPELAEGTLTIKEIARNPGTRTKIAVESSDPAIDPVGAFVGQRGVRVMAVKSELSGEQIDIINWSESVTDFIGDSLLPAEVNRVATDEEKKTARVELPENQIPIAIGRGGQNISLAAQLTGWEITIVDIDGEEIARSTAEGEVSILSSNEDQNEEREKDTAEEKEGETAEDGEKTEDEASSEEKA